MPSLLELLGGADAFPGAGDLDQDPLAVDAGLLVQADQPAGLGDGRLGVEAEAGVDLGRDAARDDLEDLAAEVDEQLVHERLGPGRSSPPSSAASVSAFSTRWAYGCFCAA